MQILSEAKDNFRKSGDVRWQTSGSRSNANARPQGERGGVHQFGVSPKTARGVSANLSSEGAHLVVSAVRDYKVALTCQLLYSTLNPFPCN
jgi:hypothetical protein